MLSTLVTIGAVLVLASVGAFSVVGALDAAHAQAVDAERAAAGLPPRALVVETGPVIAGLLGLGASSLSLGCVFAAIGVLAGH